MMLNSNNLNKAYSHIPFIYSVARIILIFMHRRPVVLAREARNLQILEGHSKIFVNLLIVFPQFSIPPAAYVLI